MKRISVLVVEPERSRRAEYADWLAGEGFDVLECPGPSAPDYTCLGGRGEACPLAQDADVVVLDMRLGSDDAMQGTPGWQLLAYYVEHGDRVVALSDEADFVHPLPDGDVAVLRRPPHRRSLIRAVQTLARQSTRGQSDGDDSAR